MGTLTTSVSLRHSITWTIDMHMIGGKASGQKLRGVPQNQQMLSWTSGTPLTTGVPDGVRYFLVLCSSRSDGCGTLKSTRNVSLVGFILPSSI